MKFLLENWRKLLEGNVIQFPQQPKISDEDLQFVIMVESSIQRRLEAIYGNTHEVPLKKFEKMEEIINGIEELLKK